MIVLQGGIVELVASVIVLIAVFVGVVYFIALPCYVFMKLTRSWKERNRVILFASYFGVFSLTGYVFWILPGYYLQTYHIDILGSLSHRVSMYLFFFLPLIYIGVVDAIRLTRKQIAISSS